MTGAGFLPRGKVVRKSSGFVLRLKRIRSLPDTVGPNMQVLIIGLNPSPYSADTGIGYGLYSASGSWTEEVDCLRDGFDSSLTLRGGDDDEPEIPHGHSDLIEKESLVRLRSIEN